MTNNNRVPIGVRDHRPSANGRKFLSGWEISQLLPNVRRQGSRESERPIGGRTDGLRDQRGMNGSFSICAGCQVPRMSTSTGASPSIGGDR